MNAKKKLDDERQVEADRLSAIFEQRRAEFHFTQETFGRDNAIGTQTVVSHFLNGHMPLHVLAAAKFARGLFCAISDFSPRLAKEIEEAGLSQGGTDYDRHFGNTITAMEARLIDFYRALGKEGKRLLSIWADHYLASKTTTETEPAPEAQPFFATLLDTPLIGNDSSKTSSSAHSTNPATAQQGQAQANNQGAKQHAKGRKKNKRE